MSPKAKLTKYSPLTTKTLLINYPNSFAIESRRINENIEYYILHIKDYNIKYFNTTKRFFQKLYEKDSIQFIGSFSKNELWIERSIFIPVNITDIFSLIIFEISNSMKITKKQKSILAKSYNKIIYRNERNYQFYIIPHIEERSRIRRYENIHKNTFTSLANKELIKNQIGQIYILTQLAESIVEEQSKKEIEKYNINISIEDWINTSKLMREYITRIE